MKKPIIETIVTYEDYTLEETKSLAIKHFGISYTPDDALKGIQTVLNILQQIYGAEEQDIPDTELFMQALCIYYHRMELYEAFDRL